MIHKKVTKEQAKRMVYIVAAIRTTAEVDAKTTSGILIYNPSYIITEVIALFVVTFSSCIYHPISIIKWILLQKKYPHAHML